MTLGSELRLGLLRHAEVERRRVGVVELYQVLAFKLSLALTPDPYPRTLSLAPTLPPPPWPYPYPLTLAFILALTLTAVARGAQTLTVGMMTARAAAR